ncbi:MAG TPA: type II/IV secretion system ATPase subunit, partial [Candidatus Hodarchaeales archaeon]|nr:type II/IV secretion system ATPase subunit [Candidatus Hodarchaeales archaeon]
MAMSELSHSIVKETYPLSPPFAYALLQLDPRTKETTYSVMESPLTTKEADYLKIFKQEIVAELSKKVSEFHPEEKGGKHVSKEDKMKDFLRNEMRRIQRKYGEMKLDQNTFEKLHYHVTRDLMGFGLIDSMLKDERIEDISCLGARIPIYVWHRDYESIRTNLRFDTEEELDNFVIKVAQRAGKHISVASPLLDAALPDGSRINCTYSNEVTMRGSTFTIRKFRTDPITVIDQIQYGTIDENLAAYFWYALENQKSILIAGGTASGKTSLLNSLAMFIRPSSKIVSIEDTPELNLPHENWIPAVARQGFGAFNEEGGKRGEVNMYDLLRAAVRQRPDFLFVGEVRGSEAYVLMQAMATGHSGMATIHGDS